MPKGGLVSAARFQFTLLKEPREPVAFESPHIRKSKTVLHPGLHAVDSGFQVLDSGFLGRGTWIQESNG